MRWKIQILLVVLGLVTLCSEVWMAEQSLNEENDDGAVVVDNDDENETPAVADISTDDERILNYESPTAEKGRYYLAEHFDDHSKFLQNWIKSQAKKDDISEEIAKYDGEWSVEAPFKKILKNDLGLVLKSKAKHAAIASRLVKPFKFDGKDLIVQYEVTMQDGQECGGSYIKLLSSGKETADLTTFNDKTPYSIMFGPDKCGNDIKMHFIFRHINPLNGTITEKHCRKPKERLEEPFKDKLPHLYRLVLRPDNTFEIRVDHRAINEGSLLTDFNPPVNPPEEIDDPNDKKPEDWDEREKIPDPSSRKPEDWNEDAPPQIPDPNAVKPDGWLDDEEEMVPDQSAQKPEDWDTEIDGDWEAPLIENPICEKAVGCGLWKAPLISNPDYKGKWRAPLIDNVNYKGKWAPRKIPNPDFFEDLKPYRMTQIEAVGIELWSMSSNILFDNLLVTDDHQLANEWAAKTFDLKRRQIDIDSKTLWERAMRYMGHKPGWWAIYFVYISIPIAAYAFYLYRRYNEETFFHRVVQIANDNPLIWLVYASIAGLPLVFLFYWLRKEKKSPDSGSKKKTDDPTPDDDKANADADKDRAAGGDADNSTRSVKKNTSPKHNKSDLEVNNSNMQEAEPYPSKDQEVDDNNDTEEEEEEEKENKIADVPAANETEESSSPTPAQASQTEGARKRKPRKD